MIERKVTKVVQGQPAIDGAGVHLVRVLGKETIQDFDPFLMLDSFDSTNSADYIRGFPMHPHRGIETITYLASGKIVHEDSLGNRGVIEAGGTQWMTAGSGILHEEMPQAAERMLGLQVWLNLPQDEKMTEPKYFDIVKEDVVVVEESGYKLRIVSGNFGGQKGVQPHHLQASIFDVSLEPGAEITIPTEKEETVFIFLLEGNGEILGDDYQEKSAILFGKGDIIRIKAKDEQPTRFLFFQAPPLSESIAWGGPIVMNTRAELQLAFDELREGTFIKHR